ncbi:hypothetical protein ACFLR4_01980 [Bacteroidota bacterium]
MSKHITIVAVLHIGFSILGLLLGVGLYFLLAAIGVTIDDYEGSRILIIIGTVIGIFFVALSVPGLIGGIGLLGYRPWARILIMIVSAVDLINIPFGTIVGGYSLWVLVQDEVVEIFNSQEQN